jgi:hypothetical protein
MMQMSKLYMVFNVLDDVAVAVKSFGPSSLAIA